jgi:hypothetical protein
MRLSLVGFGVCAALGLAVACGEGVNEGPPAPSTAAGSSGSAGALAGGGAADDVPESKGGAGGGPTEGVADAGASPIGEGGEGGGGAVGLAGAGGSPIGEAGAAGALGGGFGGEAGTAPEAGGAAGATGGAAGDGPGPVTCNGDVCSDDELCVVLTYQPLKLGCFEIGHAGSCDPDPAKYPHVTHACAGFCEAQRPGCQKTYTSCSAIYGDDGEACPSCGSWDCGPE